MSPFRLFVCRRDVFWQHRAGRFDGTIEAQSHGENSDLLLCAPIPRTLGYMAHLYLNPDRDSTGAPG